MDAPSIRAWKFISTNHVRLVFVAPEQLRMPVDITARLKSLGIQFEETDDLTSALKKADVLYMTRIQKERFTDAGDYERLKDSYILTRQMVENLSPKMVILHPFPRVNEIATDVDTLHGAAYFRQARNGVYIRMALLALIAGKIQ